MRPTRLLLALLLVLPLVAALASVASSQQFTMERVTGGSLEPVDLTSPPNDSRLFIVSRQGHIRVFKNGSLLPAKFLDVEADTLVLGESGMLGMAFHPDYANNGKFYVSWCTTASAFGDSAVSQFTVSAGNPDVADPLSRVDIFGPLPQAISSHKAGDLAFGPDGMLYYSIGDGSPAGDAFMHAQDLLDPRGKMHRFDVDQPFPHVALGNPFIGNPNGLDTIWAYGLRNPFKFEIDQVTGDLWIGDVGQSDREEVNHAPGGVGGLNFGWRCFEGDICGNKPECAPCNDPMFREPVHSYSHDNGFGCAIIGGNVYRGGQIPSMEGRYIFAEHCTDRTFSFRLVGGVATDLIEHTDTHNPPDNLSSLNSCTGVCADSSGNLYVLDYFGDEFFRIVPLIGYYDLELGLAGTHGIPNLAGSGNWESGGNVTLTLSAALENTTAALVIGFSKLSAPFKDGTLVPNPDVLVTGLPTGAGGTLVIPGTLPGGMPPEFTAWMQYWITDPAGPKGFSASNALSATTAP